MASKTGAARVPVALPKGSESPGAASLVSQDASLYGAIGARVKVTTASATVEGTIYTADPVTSLLVVCTETKSSSSSSTTISPSSLSAPAGSYRIIPISQIQSSQIISPAPSAQDQPPTHNQPQTLDTASLNARLARAVDAAQSAQLRIGPKGTSPTDQALFDALSRTHPARWEGSAMVISDSFVIEKPYNASSVGVYRGEGGAKDGGFRGDVERMRKVVDMELSKVKLRMGKGVVEGRIRKGG